MKKHFPIGSLDKAGKNVKTEKGWVPVKGNEHLVSEEAKNQREHRVQLKEALAERPAEGERRFASIQEAQTALAKKEITHNHWLREQHRLLKIKRDVTK